LWSRYEDPEWERPSPLGELLNLRLYLSTPNTNQPTEVYKSPLRLYRATVRLLRPKRRPGFRYQSAVLMTGEEIR